MSTTEREGCTQGGPRGKNVDMGGGVARQRPSRTATKAEPREHKDAKISATVLYVLYVHARAYGCESPSLLCCTDTGCSSPLSSLPTISQRFSTYTFLGVNAGPGTGRGEMNQKA